jgi:hypothetical protein
MSWYHSIEASQRRIGFGDLFKIRLIGETVTDLTLAGPFLGEPVKALIASSQLPTTQCIASIVIENLIFSISVVIFISTGMLVLLVQAAIPANLKIAGMMVSAMLIVPALLVYLAILRRWLLLSQLTAWLQRQWPQWERGQKIGEKVRQFEEAVYSFAGTHKGLFLYILLLELLTHLSGVAEAWLILQVTAGKAQWLSCLLIESSYRIVNVLFAFVPLRLGVDESGTALTLKALGYGAGMGVSLAIIRKIRIFFWMAVGLLLLARHTLRARRS